MRLRLSSTAHSNSRVGNNERQRPWVLWCSKENSPKCMTKIRTWTVKSTEPLAVLSVLRGHYQWVLATHWARQRGVSEMMIAYSRNLEIRFAIVLKETQGNQVTEAQQQQFKKANDFSASSDPICGHWWSVWWLNALVLHIQRGKSQQLVAEFQRKALRSPTRAREPR